MHRRIILSSKVNIDTFWHIYSQHDLIPYQMGPGKDAIRMFASKPNQLVVDSDVIANGDFHVKGAFTVDGKDLMAIIKSLQKKVDALKSGGGGSGDSCTSHSKSYFFCNGIVVFA